jgi:ribosome maturation factor RimP
MVQKIQATIEPSLDAMGYTVVLIKMGEGAKRKTLTIMAERKDDVTMGFDDCTQISRMVGALLEVDDPISGAYNLEVCSPGIDRPLTKPADFERYKGYEAKIETMLPVNSRRRFKGELKGIKDEVITIHMPEGDAEITYGNIRAAKLVMTDELVGSHMKQQKKKAKR